MNDGKVGEICPTQEVLNNPKNVRTKEFLQKVYKILFLYPGKIANQLQ